MLAAEAPCLCPLQLLLQCLKLTSLCGLGALLAALREMERKGHSLGQGQEQVQGQEGEHNPTTPANSHNSHSNSSSMQAAGVQALVKTLPALPPSDRPPFRRQLLVLWGVSVKRCKRYEGCP